MAEQGRAENCPKEPKNRKTDGSGALFDPTRNNRWENMGEGVGKMSSQKKGEPSGLGK